MGSVKGWREMNEKELWFNSVIATACTMASAALGGWDIALKVLIALMVADYITGLLGAIKNKNVSSDVMFWGGIRKGAILAVLLIAVLLDEMVNNQEPILRTLVIYFYVAREGISLTENLGKIGVPLPGAFKEVLAQLQEKGDKDG